ncbi:hypothetical protein RvY_03002 [Ramazzottius varieornatus]|uniref:Uncharacterized protein n=1 Tax=Ramazzottius varieornatus TaxID=947166 RepID=A0A1D1UTN0_RAMVA|nr:hypothetical protein RvY_03002 [Ramazzottius varieornatus]
MCKAAAGKACGFGEPLLRAVKRFSRENPQTEERSLRSLVGNFGGNQLLEIRWLNEGAVGEE